MPESSKSVREDDPMHDKFIAAKILGVITKNFGALTSSRGLEYSRSGRVSADKYIWDPTDGELSGMVQGTARHPYEVGLVLAKNYEQLSDNYCTCPVHYECKH